MVDLTEAADHPSSSPCCNWQPAETIFFVRSGKVDVVLPSGVIFLTLRPGDCFGERSVVHMKFHVRDASFRAVGYAYVLGMSLVVFNGLCVRGGGGEEGEHAGSSDTAFPSHCCCCCYRRSYERAPDFVREIQRIDHVREVARTAFEAALAGQTGGGGGAAAEAAAAAPAPLSPSSASEEAMLQLHSVSPTGISVASPVSPPPAGPHSAVATGRLHNPASATASPASSFSAHPSGDPLHPHLKSALHQQHPRPSAPHSAEASASSAATAPGEPHALQRQQIPPIARVEGAPAAPSTAAPGWAAAALGPLSVWLGGRRTPRAGASSAPADSAPGGAAAATAAATAMDRRPWNAAALDYDARHDPRGGA